MVYLMISGVKLARDNRSIFKTQSKNNNSNNKGRQYFATHPRIREIAEKKLLLLSQ